MRIIDINVNEQSKALYRADGGGNVWRELGEKGKEQVLTEAQILELSDLIVKIEKHYGFPCDIEWAFEDGKFYIVQSRPITTLLEQQPQKDNQINIFDQFRKEQWTKVWATEYSLFSAVLFSREYVESTQSEVQEKFSKIIFEYKNGLVTLYRIDAEQKSFGENLAKKSVENKNFAKKIVQQLAEIHSAISSLLQQGGNVLFKKETYSHFLFLHRRLLPYFISVAWTADALDRVEGTPEKKKRLFQLFNNARKQVESVYSDIEKFIKEFLDSVAERENINKNLTQALTPGDVEKYLSQKVLPESSILKDRFQFSVLLTNDGGGELLFGKQAQIFMESVNPVPSLERTEIHGEIAYGGHVTGRVKKVFTEDQASQMLCGDILVTTMTRPDWIVSLKTASAFVTDAGGILSHAAIVSRELKKPCIIGTKIATQVLHDGDLVEVDADNGVVRVLERAGA